MEKNTPKPILMSFADAFSFALWVMKEKNFCENARSRALINIKSLFREKELVDKSEIDFFLYGSKK